jgi:hypothetical protein
MTESFRLEDDVLVIMTNSFLIRLSIGPEKNNNVDEIERFRSKQIDLLELSVGDSNGCQLTRTEENTYILCSYAGAFGYHLELIDNNINLLLDMVKHLTSLSEKT